MKAQHEAVHVADTELRGKSDDEIVEHCRSTNATLVSADLDFSNVHRYPLGTHDGIVIVRLPNEMSVARGNDLVVSGILEALNELKGSVLVIEPGKVRLRKVP